MQDDASAWRNAVNGVIAEHKLISFHFMPFLGMFVECNIDPGPSHQAVDEWFDDVRIVDEFNFSYGWVPDTFKDVEGYKNSCLLYTSDAADD